MKVRLVAILLILFVAAWLPIAAQQSPAPQSAPQSAPQQAEPSCCHGQDANSAHSNCCEGKGAKDMACCKKDAQGKPAADCCKGQDTQMCAKNEKGCCKQADGKSRCEKTTANKADSAAKCCAVANHPCCHGKSQA
jgi:hypothetical protein